jgi:hypothetical protein
MGNRFSVVIFVFQSIADGHCFGIA